MDILDLSSDPLYCMKAVVKMLQLGVNDSSDVIDVVLRQSVQLCPVLDTPH